MSTHPVLYPMNIWRQYSKSLQRNGVADIRAIAAQVYLEIMPDDLFPIPSPRVDQPDNQGPVEHPLSPPMGRVERTCRVEFQVRLTEKKARKSLAVGPFPRVTSLGEGPKACPTSSTAS